MDKKTSGFRNSFIALSAGYVIIGLFLLLMPNFSLEAFYKIVSIIMIILGVTHILIYFIKDHMSAVIENDLVSGVVYAAFGAFMLLHPEFVDMAFPFGIGILLLIGGLIKLQNAIDMKRMQFKHWWVLLIFVVILLVLGAILIYRPFGGRALLIYIGCSLIIDGVVNIITMLIMSHRYKKIQRGELAPAGRPPAPGYPGPGPEGGPQSYGPLSPRDQMPSEKKDEFNAPVSREPEK